MAVTGTAISSTSVTNIDTTLATISTEGIHVVTLDLSNLAAGDIFQFWFARRMAGTGNYEEYHWRFTFRDAQEQVFFQFPIPVVVSSTTGAGTEVHGIRLAGTNRNVSGRYEQTDA